jgi:hypothetical protein
MYQQRDLKADVRQGVRAENSSGSNNQNDCRRYRKLAQHDSATDPQMAKNLVDVLDEGSVPRQPEALPAPPTRPVNKRMNPIHNFPAPRPGN